MLIILTKPEFLNSKALELVSWQNVLGNWLSETEVAEKILQEMLINPAKLKLLNSKALKLRYFNKKFEESA